MENVCSFQVIKSTEEFEKALKKMQFLNGDTTDLLKYARNVNSHFAHKKCQDVIVAARNLMTSEIHNTVKVLLMHHPVLLCGKITWLLKKACLGQPSPSYGGLLFGDPGKQELQSLFRRYSSRLSHQLGIKIPKVYFCRLFWPGLEKEKPT